MERGLVLVLAKVCNKFDNTVKREKKRKKKKKEAIQAGCHHKNDFLPPQFEVLLLSPHLKHCVNAAAYWRHNLKYHLVIANE